MLDTLKDIFLWIHIPAGTISLILFWVPVFTKKGGNTHRKLGIWYYRSMWIVQLTAVVISVINVFMGYYTAAAFLGYLALLTGQPLWYSYEILQQGKVWTDSYFVKRRLFALILFVCSLGMLGGAIYLQFNDTGVLMAFFGVLGIPSIKEVMMTKTKAMDADNRLQTHISGTIITGIAAYTAFLAFGGRTLLGDLLSGYWQIIPWILPTIIGVTIIRMMKSKQKRSPKIAS